MTNGGGPVHGPTEKGQPAVPKVQGKGKKAKRPNKPKK